MTLADDRYQLNNDDHDKVEQALEYSLKQLDTPYIDLWLMHCKSKKSSDDPDLTAVQQGYAICHLYSISIAHPSTACSNDQPTVEVSS